MAPPSGQRPTGTCVIQRAAGTILRPAFFMPVTNSEPYFAAVPFYIALGSNLGDRLPHLQQAVEEIHLLPDCQVSRVSSVWETEAHVKPGSPPQPDFLNAVLECRSALQPEDMLSALLTIEQQHGRDRSAKGAWKPRPLDLDIILAGDMVHQTKDLMLPHPRLAERRFVLAPLAEIASDVEVPPPFEHRVGYLLSRCPDQSDITLTSHILHLPHSA